MWDGKFDVFSIRLTSFAHTVVFCSLDQHQHITDNFSRVYSTPQSSSSAYCGNLSTNITSYCSPTFCHSTTEGECAHLHFWRRNSSIVIRVRDFVVRVSQLLSLLSFFVLLHTLITYCGSATRKKKKEDKWKKKLGGGEAEELLTAKLLLVSEWLTGRSKFYFQKLYQKK